MHAISAVTAFGFIGASLIASPPSFASAIFDIDNSTMYTYSDGLPSVIFLKNGQKTEENDEKAKNFSDPGKSKLSKEEYEVFSQVFDKLQDKNGSSPSSLSVIQSRLSRAAESLNTVVVYSSRLRKSDHGALKSFSDKTGIKLRLTEARGKIVIEKSKNSPPDVIILVGADQREEAAKADLFYRRPSLKLNRMVPQYQRDRDSRWYVLDTSHKHKSYVGIAKNTKNKQNGIELIEYLLSPKVSWVQGYVDPGSRTYARSQDTIAPKTTQAKDDVDKVMTSSTPSAQQVQKTEVKVSQNNFHEQCKDARDYQGCLNAFTGGASSSSSGLTQYERQQLELQRQQLEQQRSTTRYNQMVEEQNRARQQRQDRNKALMNMLNGMNKPLDLYEPPASVTCRSRPDFFGGSTTTCQ